ncbi:MAG: HAMP domain-containing histidine kinase [Alphaproteobacteria bacterium]|nr:MAG: HAMP domain-containing histidine kinase [Alphaproteobacteria bacterium]
MVYLGVFSGSAFLVLIWIYWSTAGFMARQTDETLNAEITGLAEQYRQRQINGLLPIVANRSERRDGSIYIVMTPTGRRLAGNLSSWPATSEVEPGALFDFKYDAVTPEGTQTHNARGRFFVLEGGFLLLVGRDVQERLETQNRIISSLYWGLGLTIVIGLIGAIVISRNMVARIDAFNRTSRDIMGGDLSRRVPLSGTGDEMDQLGQNLNAMLDKIERLMVGMREVTDNIAHDLRSPLNRIRSRVEVTLMKENEGDAYREALQETVREADELLSTFNALLAIARAEAGAARETMKEISISSVVRDTAELYEPVAEEKGQTFEVDIDELPPIWGNREMVAQAVANLIDNAIKYSPEGGAISVSLKPGLKGALEGRDSIRLTVKDTGPGIPAADRDRVRNRFVRLELSRSKPGSGLGLSLVSAVAQLHDARLTFSDNEPENQVPGLRVTMIFPAYDSKTA